MLRLSPTLSLYMSRTFLLAFAAALAAMMSLILLFDTLELIRRLAARNVDFSTVLSLALMKLPQMMNVILPFAVMVGGMIAFWRMTRSHELIVARAIGVSIWQVLTPVMAVVLLIGIFNVTAFNPLAAMLYSRYERSFDSLSSGAKNQSGTLTLGEEGLWLRENRGDSQIVVHASHVRQNGDSLRLRNISFLFLDKTGAFSHRLDARLGELRQNEHGGLFLLEQAYLTRPGQPAETLPRYELTTTLTLESIQDKFAAPESISFWELPKFIAFFEQSGFTAYRQKLYWHSLIASPLLLCAMVLIAAVFSLRPNLRSGGLLWRISGCVVAGLLFYFFSKVVYAMGQTSLLPLLLAAWAPVLLAGMVSTATLLHLEDG